MVLCLRSSQSKSSVKAALYAHLFLLGQGETTNRTRRKIPNQKYTTWWLSTEAATLTVDLKGGIYIYISISIYAVCFYIANGTLSGKIQGDGRKFMDRFKSYIGSQISQSLNEVRMYQLQPKSATKGDFFHNFCLWLFRVGVTDCKLQTKSTKCC